MSQAHKFDRLAINRTMRDVRFKPDQAFNSVRTESDVETRMAPFLTASSIFQNVTREPQVVTDYIFDAFEDTSFIAQFGALNRFWFGWMENITSPNDGGGNGGVGVTGHYGLGPISNKHQGGNTSRGIAKGILPGNMTQQDINIGAGFVGEGSCGERIFYKTVNKDGVVEYVCPSFDVLLDMGEIFQAWDTYAGTVTFTVPEIKMNPLDGTYKQQYFLVNDGDRPLSTLENHNFIPIREETLRTDFVAIKIGNINKSFAAAGVPADDYSDFYMFIPLKSTCPT